METAAVSDRTARPRWRLPARVRGAGLEDWLRLAFVALCLAFAAGIIVFPTYPNYDSYYSLLWGREILDGGLPSFDGFRHPTEHPLAVAAGVVLALFGEAGDRLWIALTFGAFLALAAGVYRLARVAFTPLVGAIAALLLLTRFDFAFLAARGYIDIPYMALIVWAFVLEAQRPRRGTAVFALLTAAGLLRVEAWFLAGMYWLWLNARRDVPLRRRVAWSAWTWAAPLIWFATDWVVTGDPLFSVHHTSELAEDLGRSRSLVELPGALPGFFAKLVKTPVLLAALAGAVAAIVLVPRRTVWPLVLLGSGIATFVAIGAAGASIIERYLVVASLALMIFAAFALGGWTMLQRSRLRTGWAAAAALAVVAGVTMTALNLDLRRFDSELSFRGDAHRSLEYVLEHPDVRAGMRCGPVTLPNHKLVPDTRWIADLPYGRVRSRAEAALTPYRLPQRGVEIFVTSRFAIFKHAFTSDADPAAVQVPRDGWVPAARSKFYAAYVRC